MFESLQAKILAVAAAISVVLSVIATLFGKNRIKEMKDYFMLPFVVLINVLVLLLIIFDTNCVIIGGCNVWGWFKFAFFAILILLTMIMTINNMFKKAPEEEEEVIVLENRPVSA